MDGGAIHKLEVDRVKEECSIKNISVVTQFPATNGDMRGFIDLVAYIKDQFIAIEIERTSRRIAKDIEKAKAVGATELMIIATNPAARAAIKRRLTLLKEPTIPQRNAWIYLGCLPQALQRLSNYL